ncbi:MAG: zinc ribbon domain-containing protein [Candidatus Eisenbacteria bacterium]|nr:zinc ribbon domain-containing protein [Candidatus Eisenbacteria bacterium]
MPLYEYCCGKCGHEFEELESIADRDKPRKCPECGSRSVSRKVSVFAANVGGGSSTSCGPSGAT